jgi:hypothetical protein
MLNQAAEQLILAYLEMALRHGLCEITSHPRGTALAPYCVLKCLRPLAYQSYVLLMSVCAHGVLSVRSPSASVVSPETASQFVGRLESWGAKVRSKKGEARSSGC